MADFKLPTLHHWTGTWEETCIIGSQSQCQPAPICHWFRLCHLFLNSWSSFPTFSLTFLRAIFHSYQISLSKRQVPFIHLFFEYGWSTNPMPGRQWSHFYTWNIKWLLITPRIKFQFSYMAYKSSMNWPVSSIASFLASSLLEIIYYSNIYFFFWFNKYIKPLHLALSLPLHFVWYAKVMEITG